MNPLRLASAGYPPQAKILLCVGLVPVMILGPLVVVGFWPGLNLNVELAKPSASGLGWNLMRIDAD